MNLALLVLRATLGLLMTGHGAQKLFGSFEGPGVEGTEQMMESMDLTPGRPWAIIGGASEFGGGLLTTLGLLNPLGPVGIIGSMAMATMKVHGVKPIWAQEGGGELPVTNAAIATALTMAGPGKYSVDHALGINLPRWIGPLGILLALYTVTATTAEDHDSVPPEESVQEGASEQEGANG